MTSKLPHHAELHLAQNKKFRELIVFVPFYGGTKKSIQRHVEFVNELGFDCVSYNLQKETLNPLHAPIASNMSFGMKHIWADQIESILNHFVQDKIIFSFSNPSASAIQVIANRNGAAIKGLICDSGPSGEVWNSILNYFTHEKPISFLPLKWAITTISTLSWSPQFLNEVHKDLSLFPEQFPVLSIRGWKDKLITPHMIDKIFDKHTQIKYQKLSLPQAGHLNGLRDFSDEYKPLVSQFLKSIGTSLF